jgi:pyrroline-5-carboxylate reductase
MKTKLGFIGVGKIAGAVIKGLCTSDIKSTVIYLSPRNEENSTHLAEMFSNVYRLESNQAVLDGSEVVFISLRPNDAGDVLPDLTFKNTHVVVSFIPFLGLSELAEIVAPATDISRAIPLPTVVHHHCPIPVLNANDTVTRILSHIGQPLPVEDENQLHTLWALTGLIAPFYSMLKELSDWAVSNGVDETAANQYIMDMYFSLLFSSRKTQPIDFSELIRQSATPKGMNEQADKEVREKGGHELYRFAADNLLKRFT